MQSLLKLIEHTFLLEWFKCWKNVAIEIPWMHKLTSNYPRHRCSCYWNLRIHHKLCDWKQLLDFKQQLFDLGNSCLIRVRVVWFEQELFDSAGVVWFRREVFKSGKSCLIWAIVVWLGQELFDSGKNYLIRTKVVWFGQKLFDLSKK